MVVPTLEFLITVGVGALFLVLAVVLLCEVLAELGLVLGLDLVLGVFELAVLPLPALVLQEVPANPIPLQPEELLQLSLVAHVQRQRRLGGRRTSQD